MNQSIITKQKFLIILFVFAIAGCKDTEFLYLNKPTASPVFAVNHPVAEIQANSQVDILWVIDNSGSMESSQQGVIDNTQVFMEEFTKISLLNWKMGLISTDDISDDPYIGFAPNDDLNYQSSSPVTLFQDAVRKLGLGGSGSEKTFVPVMKAFKSYPGFNRNDALLALIVVTDAPEQSGDSYSNPRVTAPEFIQYLKGIKTDLKNVVTYGVFGAKDLGCKSASYETEWDYYGTEYSAYREVVDATKGKVYALCKNFGANLAALGKDLVGRIPKPRVYLSHRPIVSSIQVSYRGTILPGGLKEDGGFWVYDYSLNAIIFNNLSFSTEDGDVVSIRYEEDRGL